MCCTLLEVDHSRPARAAMLETLAVLRPAWRAMEAEDADHALSRARRAPPDAAVIDFDLRAGDELVVASELGMLQPQILLAVISANFQDDILPRARQVRAAFLPKPLRPEALGASSS